MADYSSIKGNRISYLDSDPTLSSANEGQVWYNSATGGLKGLVQIKAWSAGGNMNTARSGGSGSGSQTAALSFGGTDTPGARTTATESYSGYVWTTSPNSMNTARANLGAAGTQTATLAFGGVIGAPTFASQSATESWNGTSWTTSPATINTARYSLAGFGTQTAAVAAGGTTGTETELYDGTAWTSNPTGLNTSRRAMGSAGTQTAGLVFGGGDGPAASAKTATESWNGSTWTSVNSIGTARYSLAGFGTQTSAVAALGNLVPGTITAATEEYDGTSWITTISASTARGAIPGSAGTSKAGLVFGGYTTVRTTTTEEYNSEINSITQAVWTSGGNYPSSVFLIGSATNSPQTASLAFGGQDPARVNTSNEYNGTSWTAGGTMPAVYADGMEGGTQTAAFGAGGYQPARTNVTVEYNGTSWSSGGNLSAVCSQGCGTGTLTAGLVFGGEPNPSNIFKTAEYDGTSWADVNNLNQATTGNATAFGTQTAAIRNRGINPGVSPSFCKTTESYDGTSWTTLSDSNFGGRGSGGFGTQSDGVSYGGEAAPASTILTVTEQWDGTAWVSTANLADTNGYSSGNAGSASAGLSIAGFPNTNTTREFSGQTSTITASTLTTS